MTIKNHLTEADINRLISMNKNFLHDLLAVETELKNSATTLFQFAEKGTVIGEASFQTMNNVRDTRRECKVVRKNFEGIQRRLKKMQRGQ